MSKGSRADDEGESEGSGVSEDESENAKSGPEMIRGRLEGAEGASERDAKDFDTEDLDDSELVST